MPVASLDSIQFHMVSYCSAIKLRINVPFFAQAEAEAKNMKYDFIFCIFINLKEKKNTLWKGGPPITRYN